MVIDNEILWLQLLVHLSADINFAFCVFGCMSTPGIRQLQLMLLKVSLILGVEVHINVEFIKLLEPPEEQTNDGEFVITVRGR